MRHSETIQPVTNHYRIDALNAVPASPSQIATMHLQRIDQTFGLLATKEDARSCWAIS
ncbi:hypothetical protein [Enterobacter sp. A8]|uniref:hypothetical protein n=1 Tax=Enterobacter sp. A8 TaxID=2507249 RepID=UPI001A9E58F4|nr:hypothetical protein [Enterobacter sp. A8]